MPIMKSAAKRMRQSENNRLSNANVKTSIKSARSRLFAAFVQKDVAKATTLFSDYCSLLDKSAKKGVIGKNTAVRRKGRASEALKALAK